MNIKTKNALYLAALLQHIDNYDVKKIFKNYIASLKETLPQTEFILSWADSYATASQGVNGNLNFVASPFENLRTPFQDYQYNHNFKELSLDSNIFPQKKDKKKVSTWSTFSNDLLAIQENNTKKLGEIVLSLLHKYATAIPNPSPRYPEISWYDYAKAKAGLAIALYDFLTETQQKELNNSDFPITIIRGDISGIQNFITNIASKHASKNLKGRSFYIQLLSDTVLRLLLNELKLYEGNVMYASGGNFFVIAPNTKKVQEAFNLKDNQSFENRVSRAIFKQHKTNISVVMGCQKVNHYDILNGNIDEAITTLFEEKIDKKKKQKFGSLITENYASFFDEKQIDLGGNAKTDCITGEELEDEKDNYNGKFYIIKDKPYPELSSTNEDIQEYLKTITAKQIFIGGHLKNTDFLVISYKQLKIDKKSEIVPLPSFEGQTIYYYLVSSKDKSYITNLNNVESVIPINNFNISSITRSFMLYGGNDYPTDEDNKPKEFSALANYTEDKDEEGIFKRLGILRMDIDGLGSLFKTYIPYPQYNEKTQKKGNKRKHLSFAYYATISRNLDWFFKGYLNTIWASNNEYKKFTQIIFSGGDDLFIIGRWDLILPFAEDIKTKFAKFTCSETQNSDHQLTISGGISIVTHKFPIIKAAEYAGDAEKKAKAHKLLSEDKILFQKNSICFFDMPLHWDSEYPIVKALKEDLLDIIDDEKSILKKGGIPKSILSKIQIHHQMMQAYKNSLGTMNPKWIWVAAYDFSRLEERLRDKSKKYLRKLQKSSDAGNKSFLEQHLQKIRKSKEITIRLKNSLFTNKYITENGNAHSIQSSYHFLELLNLAARWASLVLRSKDNQNNNYNQSSYE